MFTYFLVPVLYAGRIFVVMQLWVNLFNSSKIVFVEDRVRLLECSPASCQALWNQQGLRLEGLSTYFWAVLYCGCWCIAIPAQENNSLFPLWHEPEGNQNTSSCIQFRMHCILCSIGKWQKLYDHVNLDNNRYVKNTVLDTGSFTNYWYMNCDSWIANCRGFLTTLHQG